MESKTQDVVSELLDMITLAGDQPTDEIITGLRSLSPDDARKLAREIFQTFRKDVTLDKFGPVAEIICNALCTWNKNDHNAYVMLIDEWSDDPEQKIFAHFLYGCSRREKARQEWEALHL